MSIKQKFRDWYEGEFVPYENPPDSSVIIMGGYQKRHWTAKFVRGLGEFYMKEWKWIIGILLTITGLVIGLIKLR